MIVFVVLRAYYKHGEAKNHIFYDKSSLKEFLLEEIKRYDEKFKLDDIVDYEYDIKDEEEMIYALIKAAVKMGKDYLDGQNGWGILEITEIEDTNVYTFQ